MSTRMSERTDDTIELPADPNVGDLGAWSILAGIVLWGILAGPFFAGCVYTADDLGAFHLPVRAFYAEQLARGQPYDWMPSLFSGFYLTGEGQAGVYHPLHQLLYRMLPFRAALAWEFLASYPLMMLGMWLLLRRRLGRSDVAMFGALVFTFSSFNLLHFVHPNAVAVIAHIPWLLWAIDIAIIDSRRLRVASALALIALLTGSQLLLGYPQFVWFSLVAEFAYVVFLETSHRHAPRAGCDVCDTCSECMGCTVQTWPRIVIAKGIGLLIGGVQLLPSLDAWLHSARQSVGPNFPFWGSLDPANLVQIVAPYLFVDRVVGGNTHEFGLYVGAAPLMLVVWLVVRHRELGTSSRLAWAVAAFALLMLLLSFGFYGQIYRVVTWLPVVRGFRFPCRYLVLFQLAVAILAAMGFMLVIRQGQQARMQKCDVARWPRYAMWHDFRSLWCVVALSVAVAAVALWFPLESQVASVPAVSAGPVLMTIAALLVVSAVRGHSAALIGLILFVAVDLGWYGMSYAVYAQCPELDAYVAAAPTPPGTPGDRVVATLFRADEPGLRTGNWMMLSGWRRADGYAGLEPGRRLDYHMTPALRVAGVRWVQRGPSTSDIKGLKPHGTLWLEVPDPLPRVRLLSRTQVTTDPAGDMRRISPDDTALCEVPIDLPLSNPGTAVLAEELPGRMAIGVTCSARQLLVVAESYHCGWHAAVDGRPRLLHRVNGDFLGCVVEPGERQVVLTFEPESLRRGWFTSCMGFSLLSVYLLGTAVSPRSGAKMDDLP
jgi:hypothetical protein